MKLKKGEVFVKGIGIVETGKEEEMKTTLSSKDEKVKKKPEKDLLKEEWEKHKNSKKKVKVKLRKWKPSPQLKKCKYIEVEVLKEFNKHKKGEILKYNYKSRLEKSLLNESEEVGAFKIINFLDKDEMPLVVDRKELKNYDYNSQVEGENSKKKVKKKSGVVSQKSSQQKEANELVKEIQENKKNPYSRGEVKGVLKRFKDKDLIVQIKKELDKKHFGDNHSKLTLNLCHVTGLLPNPKRRTSAGITGPSSVGKDNEQLASFSVIPRNCWRFFTNATQASLEDDVRDIPIIGFSEINLGRQEGANKHLIEVVKQMTEGGTSAMKKDIGKGMKISKHVKGEQKAVSYGTTEAETDEEVGTRFVRLTLKSSYKANKYVNDKTLDSYSDEEQILTLNKEKPNWVEIGLTEFHLRAKKENYDVVLPYANLLKEKIDGEDIFDHNDARSKRDLKRVLNLTCAMAFIYQEQRKKKKVGNTTFIISEPFDFLQTLEISKEFFNQTYTGLDSRLTEVENIMKKLDKNVVETWIERDELQRQMEVSLNTIKHYCKILAGEGVIKGSKGCQLNENMNDNIYHGNKIYYQRCQKGVKKPLIRCQVSKIRDFFKKNGFDTLTPFKFNKNNYFTDDKKEKKEDFSKVSKNTEGIEKENFSEKKGENSHISEEIDTFELTPSKEMKQIMEDFSE